MYIALLPRQIVGSLLKTCMRDLLYTAISSAGKRLGYKYNLDETGHSIQCARFAWRKTATARAFLFTVLAARTTVVEVVHVAGHEPIPIYDEQTILSPVRFNNVSWLRVGVAALEAVVRKLARAL